MTKETFEKQCANWSVQDAIRARVAYEDTILWAIEGDVPPLPPPQLAFTFDVKPFKWLRPIKYMMPWSSLYSPHTPSSTSS